MTEMTSPNTTFAPPALAPQTFAPGYLRDHFLIAMPGMQDPTFKKSVTYICEHTEKGAMGIIINLPTSMTYAEVFEQMGIANNPAIDAQLVLAGGPVQRERGFVLHSTDAVYDSTLSVSEAVALTASRDVIEAIAEGKGPAHYLIALGYAGWSEGQLEAEIADNSWLMVPADASVMFNTAPELRWLRAGRALGVNMALMPTTAGHA